MTRQWLRVARSKHPTRPWLVVLYPAGKVISVNRTWRDAIDMAFRLTDWEWQFINEPP